MWFTSCFAPLDFPVNMGYTVFAYADPSTAKRGTNSPLIPRLGLLEPNISTVLQVLPEILVSSVWP